MLESFALRARRSPFKTAPGGFVSSRAQLIGAGGAGGGTSAWSAEGVLALTGRFGMISGRSLALRPRRAKQAPPWPGFGREHAMETDEINRGRGTSAASRCMNSSGDITIGVVPSR